MVCYRKGARARCKLLGDQLERSKRTSACSKMNRVPVDRLGVVGRLSKLLSNEPRRTKVVPEVMEKARGDQPGMTARHLLEILAALHQRKRVQIARLIAQLINRLNEGKHLLGGGAPGDTFRRDRGDPSG